MRTIAIILKKEFKQIFRNRLMLPIIFVLPFVQLLVLVHAATFEMKQIDVVVVDQDLTATSRGLVNTLQGSPFFVIQSYEPTTDAARSSLLRDEADVVVHFPPQFERHLMREQRGELQLLINAINGTAASLSHAYLESIITRYNQQIQLEWMNQTGTPARQSIFDIRVRNWYNPEMNYKTFMVPGILVILVTVLGWFLSSMNTVREREIGTIEQINVTPIKKYQFVAGKLLPFWIIALFEFGFGLLLGRLLFDVPIVGSLGLLFGVAAVYLLAALGIGLLISNMVNTQQQAMFISWFFAVIFILMSGLFTSVESMPDWAQQLNLINPIAYFIRIIRMIMLKGSGFMDILPWFTGLALYAILMLSLSVWRYRKTS